MLPVKSRFIGASFKIPCARAYTPATRLLHHGLTTAATSTSELGFFNDNRKVFARQVTAEVKSQDGNENILTIILTLQK